MKNALKWLFGIGAAVVALGTAAFLIFTYWDKILSYVTAGARVATNVLNTFTGENVDQDDPTDYYDI